MQTATTAATASGPSVLVRVRRAYDLKDTEWVGKQDPYVVLELNGHSAHTITDKSGGINPEFNDIVRLPLTPAKGWTAGTGTTTTGAVGSGGVTGAPHEAAVTSHLPMDTLRVVVKNHKTILPERFVGAAIYSLSELGSTMGEGEHPLSLPLYDKKGHNAGFVDIAIDMRSARGHRFGGMGAAMATDKTGVGMTTPVTHAVPAAATFSTVEDHTRVKERVETVRETVPVEKQYVVETRQTGEQALGTQQELVDVQERVVGETGTGYTTQQQQRAHGTHGTHQRTSY